MVRCAHATTHVPTTLGRWANEEMPEAAGRRGQERPTWQRACPRPSGKPYCASGGKGARHIAVCWEISRSSRLVEGFANALPDRERGIPRGFPQAARRRGLRPSFLSFAPARQKDVLLSRGKGSPPGCSVRKCSPGPDAPLPRMALRVEPPVRGYGVGILSDTLPSPQTASVLSLLITGIHHEIERFE